MLFELIVCVAQIVFVCNPTITMISAKIWVNASFSVFLSQTKGKNKSMQMGIQTHLVSLVVKSNPSAAGHINGSALLFVTHRIKVPPSYYAIKYTQPRQKLSCEQNKRTSVKYLPHLPIDFSPSSESEPPPTALWTASNLCTESRTKRRETTSIIPEKPYPASAKAKGIERTAVATNPLKIVNTVATGPRRATFSQSYSLLLLRL